MEYEPITEDEEYSGSEESGADLSAPLDSDPEDTSLSDYDKMQILENILIKLEQESELENETLTLDSEEESTDNSEYIRLIYEYLTQEETEEETTEEEIFTIMDKPLNDYTVTEALLCFIGVALLVGGVVYVIRKGLPLWR